MKVQQLIDQLKILQDHHGNVEVEIQDNVRFMHGIKSVQYVCWSGNDGLVERIVLQQGVRS